VQIEGGEWKPLGEFAEFKDALAAVGGPPPLQRTAGMATAPAPRPKTSGMAIASLICGIFGCLGIPAIIGLVLGIVALLKINRSGGRLGGLGIAVAGICVSGFMLISVIPLVAMTFPALAKAKARAQAVNCSSNLRQLALSARMYETDAGRFPYATNWCEALRGYSLPQKVFYCPANRDSQLCGYGYNAALSGLAEDKINASTVLFFEIPGGWNVSGGPEQAIQRGRHNDHKMVNVAFVDGSVISINQDQLEGLRWQP
jgi:prepilin-type processing-associated H-X9-DG protein